MTDTEAEHVVLLTAQMTSRPQMKCLHCGEVATLRLPLNLRGLSEKTGDFLQKHQDCPAPVQPKGEA